MEFAQHWTNVLALLILNNMGEGSSLDYQGPRRLINNGMGQRLYGVEPEDYPITPYNLCMSGFRHNDDTADGITCEDIDECTENSFYIFIFYNQSVFFYSINGIFLSCLILLKILFNYTSKV